MINISKKPHYCYYSGEIDIDDKKYIFNLCIGENTNVIEWIEEDIPENFQFHEEEILKEFKKQKRKLLKQF